MSHHLPPQSDCAPAWLHAARFVDGKKGHEAYNVLFDVLNPTEGAGLDNPIVGIVDKFLDISEKSVISIANTIFSQMRCTIGTELRICFKNFMVKFFQRYGREIVGRDTISSE